MNTFRASCRTHLNAEEFLQQIRETRGRPTFSASASRRTASIDGCFSRPASSRVPYTDTKKFEVLLRNEKEEVTEEIHTRRQRTGSASSSLKHRDGAPVFPFRSSSNTPGIPQRECHLVRERPKAGDHRADLVEKRNSVSPDPAVECSSSLNQEALSLLVKRDVNRKSKNAAAVAAFTSTITTHSSVQRACKARYAPLRAVAAGVMANHTHPFHKKEELTTITVKPSEVWLKVHPENFHATKMPTSAVSMVLSFLDEELRSEVCRGRNVDAAISDNADINPGAPSIADVASDVPVGYWAGLASTKTLPPRSVLDMSSLLMLIAEYHDEVMFRVRDPLVLWPLFQEKLVECGGCQFVLHCLDQVSHLPLLVKDELTARMDVLRGPQRSWDDFLHWEEESDMNASIVIRGIASRL